MSASRPPAGPPEKGTPFGKYELLSRLAVGGMAEIFRARSNSLGGVTRPCVIKRILPDFCANRQFVSMFIDEARILIGLRHENIVRLYDFGQVDGSYFMALEFVRGCDLTRVLENVITRGQGMNPLAAAYVARCMCDGLYHAHVQPDAQGRPLGIVHRDVSPHNVLCSWDGDVKMTDFGIAQAKHKLTLTTPGTVLGKFAYMAPEQASGSKLDPRADIFAVGVVLHEALAGERLFCGGSPVETIARVLHQQAHAPSSVKPGIPPELDRITLLALEKDPARRFQDAREMSSSLQRVLDNAGGFDRWHFRAYLETLGLEQAAGSRDDDATAPGRPGTRAPKPTPLLVKTRQAQLAGPDPCLQGLLADLKHNPNVWTLVAMGSRHQELGHLELAQSAFRVSAAAFASRGLLVQALVAEERARALIPDALWQEDLRLLAALQDAGPAGVQRSMARVDVGGFFDMLCRADPASYGADTGVPRPRVTVPLFGNVRPEDLPQLLTAARVRHHAPGSLIIREDDEGETLFAVGEGRVVVWCRPPMAQPGAKTDERVYISSLSEGDFFGEFGFLSGEPRTASVEAVVDTWTLEVDRSQVDHLIALSPQMAGPLLEFYKARVVELLMAKSPLFATLSAEHRRFLLTRARVQRYRDDEFIIREGDPGDAFFFIKRGEVEVFSEREGIPIFINKLRDGQFFGEIAVIRHTRRTANVKAMGEVELLIFTQADLEAVIAQQPQLRALLESAILDRVAEAAEQVKAATDLLK
jgi:CRP-like cAMP-binding protein